MPENKIAIVFCSFIAFVSLSGPILMSLPPPFGYAGETARDSDSKKGPNKGPREGPNKGPRDGPYKSPQEGP